MRGLVSKIKTINEIGYLKDRFVYNGEGIADINNNLLEIKKLIGFYDKAPLFVMSVTFYEIGVASEDSTMLKVSVTLRPSKKECRDKRLNRKIELCSAMSNMYAVFVDEVADWIDMYNENLVYMENLQKLNAVTEQILREQGISFKIRYVVSNNLLDYVDDDTAVYGLSKETVERLGYLDLFSANEDIAALAYIRYTNALIGCERATDLRRSKMDIVADLGLKTRKTLTKLVRGIIRRSASKQRVGLGYIQDKEKGYIGIIEKIPARPAEVEGYLNNELWGKKVLIREHTKATDAEKAQGLTKLLITYRLTPYSEQLGEVFDIPLDSLFDEQCNVLFDDIME